MHKLYILSTLFLFMMLKSTAQKSPLPYYEIPKAADMYSEGSVASRMIDGLGFRYYWATENLTTKDLNFKPTPEARTTEETIQHILELSQVIVNATLKVINGEEQPVLTFEEKRKRTLKNLKRASDILRNSKDVSHYKLLFKNKDLPFWNVINGPITDAIWHVGQVVSFRRSSGNPFPKGVSVLNGTKK